MESKTKIRLSPLQLQKIAEHHFNQELVRHGELAGGNASMTYSLTLSDGLQVVLKVASTEAVRRLRCEAGAMAREVEALRLVAQDNKVPVPKVYVYDTSHTIVPADFFIMEKMEGVAYDFLKEFLGPTTRAGIERQLGEYAHQISDIRGNRFGQLCDNHSAASWEEAFAGMMRAALDDAEDMNVALPVDRSTIEKAVRERLPALKTVLEPKLVHFDLWHANFLVKDGKISGIIDFEGALWGDPIIERCFSHLEINESILKGFGCPTLTDEEASRRELYDLYWSVLFLLLHHFRELNDPAFLAWAEENATVVWRRFIKQKNDCTSPYDLPTTAAGAHALPSNAFVPQPEAENAGLSPLVSVIMPAYKFPYLEKALDSVLAQTYSAIELIICDDSRDKQIEELVATKQAYAHFPIHYFHNPARLGEIGSTGRGLRRAKGKYIKFLHDDDILHPDCIAGLAAVMENEPNVSLASSRRQRIDEDGEPLPDIMATSFPFAGDVLINGPELVSFLGDHTINFIGEPSCIMCRRKDVVDITYELMSLNGQVIHWVGDLALCAKLLQRGNLALLSQPLTLFRVSNDQFSQIGRDQPGIGEKGHADFRKAVRNLGWYRTSGDNLLVNVAPITRLKARLFKPVNLLAALQRAVGLGSVPLATWLGARRPIAAESVLINKHLTAQNGGPRITIILLDRSRTPEALERTLSNLEQVNLYRNIDVCVLSPLTSPDLEKKARIVTVDRQEDFVTALNYSIVYTETEWVLLAEAGSEFMPSGLLMAALDLPTLPDSCQAAYADELVRLNDDELGVLLRPDTNLDLLLSFPASMSPHWFFRRSTLLEQGGFAPTSGTAFELAYQLHLIEQFGLGSIAHISEPLLTAPVSSTQEHPDELAVIRQHLKNRGYEHATLASHLPRCYAIDYGHTQQPFVSILIVVEDRLPQAQRCLESLLENTHYTNYEVLLLDHGNHATDVRNWLAGIEAIQAAQLRVLCFPETISDARLRNEAAQQARGDFLLWLGDGAGVLHKDWLQQLLNHALRPEIGAVGAKLLSADGKIRHAGLLLGLNGPAASAFDGLAHDDNGYMQRLQLDQNYSALNAECLMLRRTLFIEAGGFDEEPLLSRWADVDLCLKLQQAGFLNVWTPRTRLLMDMPQAKPAEHAEEDAMYARWLPVLARDPTYNHGFSLQNNESFKLAAPQLAWRPLQAWRPLPVVLAHHADPYGCGHYRIIQPTLALCNAGLIDGTLSGQILSPSTLERFAPDVLVLQRHTSPEHIEALRRMRLFSNAFKVYELDDYLPNLSMKNVNKQNIGKDVLKRIRQGLAHVDRFVVSTDALKEAFVGLHADIRVIENRLPVDWWGDLQGQRRTSAKPRVGWAGGNSHSGDLELIADVVKELANEVEWVFFGMCPDKLRPYIHEYHAGVPIQNYPQALADLNLDLALAPVEDNLFNQCKSNLRLLEYGACGFPVICSDIRCYQYDDLPATRVKNRFREWVDAIRMHVADLDESARRGDALRAAVHKNWMLEGDNLLAWRKAWLPD